MTFSTIGLFAGVGGIEAGLALSGFEAKLLCEADPLARSILEEKLSAADICVDVRELADIPSCDVLAAGFPCQDLSQVGKTRGIQGGKSSLVHEVFRILRASRPGPRWLLLENVPFMLQLDKGRAIRDIVSELESQGWRWAYRTVDTRWFGLPQRRRRVILLASRCEDPRPVLFGENARPEAEPVHRNQACGFYWTEGNRGIGWAIDAIPTLKGGSGLGIPSPPAIWLPRRNAIVLPNIAAAERLQGFSAGWTAAAGEIISGDRHRWRLVGNAVSVPVSRWIGERILDHSICAPWNDRDLDEGRSWPLAAWGEKGCRRSVSVTERPRCMPVRHLAPFLGTDLTELSHRAANGFMTRLLASTLRADPRFLAHLKDHVARTRTQNRRDDLSADAGDQGARQSAGDRPSLRAA